MALTSQQYLGYSQLSVTTAVGLGTIPSGATRADVVVEGNPVRWRSDGTNPTTSVGMPLAVSTPLTFSGDLSAVKVISTTGTATVNVSFYSTRTP